MPAFDRSAFVRSTIADATPPPDDEPAGAASVGLAGDAQPVASTSSHTKNVRRT
jgi:hypothetical protein